MFYLKYYVHNVNALVRQENMFAEKEVSEKKFDLEELVQNKLEVARALQEIILSSMDQNM